MLLFFLVFREIVEQLPIFYFLFKCFLYSCNCSWYFCLSLTTSKLIRYFQVCGILSLIYIAWPKNICLCIRKWLSWKLPICILVLHHVVTLPFLNHLRIHECLFNVDAQIWLNIFNDILTFKPGVHSQSENMCTWSKIVWESITLFLMSFLHVKPLIFDRKDTSFGTSILIPLHNC